MQDEQLQKLTGAYIENNIDFDEYRLQRTEYIDILTGDNEADISVDATPENDDSQTPEEELSPLMRLMLSTVLIVTLFFIFRFIMSFFTAD